MPSTSEGPCIVCGDPTAHRKDSGGRKHWRCPPTEHDQCADRRDMKRRRPKYRVAAIDQGIRTMLGEEPDRVAA